MKSVENLEIKVSYLEKENDELKSVVFDLDKKITSLEVQIEAIKNKIIDLVEQSGEERENRKPPHY